MRKTHVETYGYKTLCGLPTRPLWMLGNIVAFPHDATCKNCERVNPTIKRKPVPAA